MSKVTSHYSNGLPYKPVVYPLSPQLLFVEKENTHGLCIYMSEEQVKTLGKIEVSTVDLEDSELWVGVKNNYIVVPNLSQETIELIKQKKLLIGFFDHNINTLSGLKLS